jgi:LPS-assembly lipoprotein
MFATMRQYAAGLLVVAASSWLGGCGFHLQGAGTLPAAMAKTYLQTTDPTSDFLYRLRDALRLRGLEIVDTPEQAGAVLIISEDDTGQRVLSVSARNIPREYEIYYSVTFAVRSGAEDLLKPQSLVATRSYTYDETQVLAKGREEEVLRQALADDLVRRVVRRIESIRSQAATPVG